MKNTKSQLFARDSLIAPIIVLLLFFLGGLIFDSAVLTFMTILFSPIVFFVGIILASWAIYSNWHNKKKIGMTAILGLLINIPLLILSLIFLKDFAP